MDTRTFERIVTSLAVAQTRRQTLRHLGVALGVGAGVSLLASEGEAKRGKRRQHAKRRKSRKSRNSQTPDPFADVAITAILVEPLSEAAHDNLVVQFVNNGALSATGFRIGMTAQRTNGQIRNEVFSPPLTLAPGQGGTEKFRLGCNWLNGGTVTARTDPAPVASESDTTTGDNHLQQTFGSAICS